MVNFTDVSCYWHILDTLCIGMDKYGLCSEQGFCRVPSCESPAATVQDIKSHCNSYKKWSAVLSKQPLQWENVLPGLYELKSEQRCQDRETAERRSGSRSRGNFKHCTWEQWKEQGQVNPMMQVWSRDRVLIYWFKWGHEGRVHRSPVTLFFFRVCCNNSLCLYTQFWAF